jgi:hypothetical protein
MYLHQKMASTLGFAIVFFMFERLGWLFKDMPEVWSLIYM